MLPENPKARENSKDKVTPGAEGNASDSTGGREEMLERITTLERALQLYFDDVEYHRDVKTMSSEARGLREDWESCMAILRKDYPEEIRAPFWEAKLI
jgi:hypothetical protein